MHRKLLVIIPAIIASLLITACDSDYSTVAPKETNVLGIVKYEPQSYAHTSPNTIAIHTDEVYARKEFTGDKTTFLWGLVTIKDY